MACIRHPPAPTFFACGITHRRSLLFFLSLAYFCFAGIPRRSWFLATVGGSVQAYCKIQEKLYSLRVPYLEDCTEHRLAASTFTAHRSPLAGRLSLQPPSYDLREDAMYRAQFIEQHTYSTHRWFVGSSESYQRGFLPLCP